MRPVNHRDIRANGAGYRNDGGAHNLRAVGFITNIAERKENEQGGPGCVVRTSGVEREKIERSVW